MTYRALLPAGKCIQKQRTHNIKKQIARIVAMTIIGTPILLAQEGDILISDFEGSDYGPWEVKGDAFGKSPAKGRLGHQKAVTGFQGQALVNTYLNNDAGTGVMTSPAFTISRPYINLFVGGGGHPEKTCVELVLVNGEPVFSTTGDDDEKLFPHTWDVSALQGKEAVVRIVDNEKGSWGHINVDHIVQSDKPLVKSVQKEKMGVAQEGFVRRVHPCVCKRPIHLFVSWGINQSVTPNRSQWLLMNWSLAHRTRNAII